MQLKVVSFNIRCDHNNQDGAQSFIYRKKVIEEKIKKEMPDVIGFQEVLPHVAVWLKENFLDYYFVGCGRSVELKSEQMTVAFRKERFSLLQMDTFWLSTTPFTPGSRYKEQSSCPRTCTKVVLKEEDSGNVFKIYNTHLDHEGKTARILGMRQILSVIQKDRNDGLFAKAPLILMGDFNATPEEEEIALIEQTSEMRDATKEISGTFHGYGKRMKEKIDYIYISPEWNCNKADIWTDTKEGVFLSDHYPIEAILTI